MGPSNIFHELITEGQDQYNSASIVGNRKTT
jgi:hypothetical protein